MDILISDRMITERDILIMAYMSRGYKRRSIESLKQQTGLSEIEVSLTLRLNEDIWRYRNTERHGNLYEMNDELFDELNRYI